MGGIARSGPARLAEKLLQIRNALGLSQSQMVERLGLADEIYRSTISGFERGEREPRLTILLEYAQAAGICADVLIDDELDLPKKLPSVPQHAGAKQKTTARSKRRR